MSDVVEKAAVIAGTAAATATGVSAATIAITGTAIVGIGYGLWKLGEWIFSKGEEQGRSEAEKEFNKKLNETQQTCDELKELAAGAILDQQETIETFKRFRRDVKELEARYNALKPEEKTPEATQALNDIRNIVQRIEQKSLAKSA